jgi:integrase
MARCQLAREQQRVPKPVEEWSGELLQLLESGLPKLLQLDLEQSTRKSYDVHVRQYQQICQRLGKPSQPSASTLAKLVLGRALSGYKLSYIELGVSAVSRWAADQGWEGLGGEPLVVRALKVAGKLAVRGVTQKLPLSAQQLQLVVEVLGSVSSDGFLQARDEALFVVGWAGMFRSSELVGIRWEHVYFCSNGGIMIFVPHSKTDPGDGAWVFLSPGQKLDLGVCPVRALRQLRLVTGGQGFVFKARQSGEQPLSKSTVGVRLKKALEMAGVADWQLYAAHSLRRGGATHAAKVGLPMRLIQAMGRWRSDAVRVYLYCSPGQMFGASRRLLAGSAPGC